MTTERKAPLQMMDSTIDLFGDSLDETQILAACKAVETSHLAAPDPPDPAAGPLTATTCKASTSKVTMPLLKQPQVLTKRPPPVVELCKKSGVNRNLLEGQSGKRMIFARPKVCLWLSFISFYNAILDSIADV